MQVKSWAAKLGAASCSSKLWSFFSVSPSCPCCRSIELSTRTCCRTCTKVRMAWKQAITSDVSKSPSQSMHDVGAVWVRPKAFASEFFSPSWELPLTPFHVIFMQILIWYWIPESTNKQAMFFSSDVQSCRSTIPRRTSSLRPQSRGLKEITWLAQTRTDGVDEWRLSESVVEAKESIFFFLAAKTWQAVPFL